MAIVTLRYWAAAKEAAGVAEEKVEAETLAEALAAGLAAAAERLPAHGSAAGRPAAGRPAAGGQAAGGPADWPVDGREGRLRLVLARSSFLVDGQSAGTRPPESIRLADGAMIEVLPPFAGG